MLVSRGAYVRVVFIFGGLISGILRYLFTYHILNISRTRTGGGREYACLISYRLRLLSINSDHGKKKIHNVHFSNFSTYQKVIGDKRIKKTLVGKDVH